MAGRSRVTREAILEAAARLISQTGLASMTFQTLGETLGVTKQAIIYWFPSKSDLTRQLILPALKLEADAVVGALEEVRTGRQAIEAVIRALIAFHLEDIGRFRLICVVAQFDTQVWQVAGLPHVQCTGSHRGGGPGRLCAWHSSSNGGGDAYGCNRGAVHAVTGRSDPRPDGACVRRIDQRNGRASDRMCG